MSNMTEAQLVKVIKALQLQQEILFESTGEAVIITDMAFTVLSWNKAAEAIYGWSANEVIGRSMRDFVPLKYRDQTYTAEAQLLKERYWAGAVSQICKDGTVVSVHVTVSMVLNDDGQPEKAVAIIRNATQERQSAELYQTFFNDNVTPVFWIELKTPISTDLPVDEQIAAIFNAGYIKDISDQVSQAFGYKREVTIGAGFDSIYAADSMLADGAVYGLFDTFVANGYQLVQHEASIPIPSGKTIWAIHNVRGITQNGFLLRIWGSIIDITNRIQMEKIQTELFEQLELAVKTARLGIWTLDVAAGFFEGNDQLLAIYGLSSQDLEEGFVAGNKFIHPEDADYTNRQLAKAFDGEAVLNIRFRIIRADGNIRYLESSVTPIFNEEQELVQLLGVNLDITDRVEAEAQARLHSLIWQNVSDAVIATDSDFTILSWNSAAEKLYDVKADEAIGQSIYNFVRTQYTGQDNAKSVLALFQQQGYWRGEVIYTNKHGREFIVQSSVTALRDAAGSPVGAVAINRDISLQKQTETLLRESEARYRTLFESSTDGILIADADSKSLLYANQALCQLFSYHPEELDALRLSDLFLSAQLPDVFVLSNTALNKTTMVNEFPCIDKSRKIFYADISGSVMTIDGRACQVGFFRDVSERRLMSALKEKSEELSLFNNAMLDRESRIIELKEEVNRLQAELGRAESYPPIWEEVNSGIRLPEGVSLESEEEQ